MLRRAVLCLLLAGCAPTGAPSGSPVAAPVLSPVLPPAEFARTTPAPIAPRTAAQWAEDFVALNFELESGRRRDRFTRFEGPITLRVTGAPPASAAPDIDRLLARLRAEAGIAITPTTAPDATITVEFLSRRQLSTLAPAAACFVAPNVAGWDDYRRARRQGGADWSRLDARQQAAIFIPNDIAPQEIRDCLHEEVAQALGPLNDLYRLPDSVFNDDNFHAVLTGFDMAILRATYAPALRSGMTEAEVRAALPGLFPARAAGPRASATPQDYGRAIATALGPRTGLGARENAARHAVAIAAANGWRDARAGFAWFALGEVLLARDPEGAWGAFAEAAKIYHADPALALQAAHADAELAAFAAANGAPEAALRLTKAARPVALRAQNAALLARIDLVRSEALSILGNDPAALRARLDSQAWARYGFGIGADPDRAAP